MTAAKVDTGYSVIDGSRFDVADPTNGVVPLSMSVEGLEGTGKTYFGLMTGPLPVVHVNFSDRDATPFLYDMMPERRLLTRLHQFRARDTGGWSRQEGKEALVKLSEIAQEEMADGKMRGGTFIIDSGSSWWEVVQEVFVAPELERQQQDYGKQVGGLAYGSGNLIVKGIINWLKAQGAFVILTHQLTQVWDAKGPVPGKWRARQNNQVPYMVEVQMRLSKTCNACGGPECMAPNHIGRTHWSHLMKFGKRTELEGTTFSNPSMSAVYGMYTGRKLPNVPETRVTDGDSNPS